MNNTIEIDRDFFKSILDHLCTKRENKDKEKVYTRGMAMFHLEETKVASIIDLECKAVEKWNGDEERIKEYVKELEKTRKDDAYFYWNQLVWQEILMYISIVSRNGTLDHEGNYTFATIDRDDIEYICKRRGFGDNERNYLYEMIVHLGIRFEDGPKIIINDDLLCDDRAYEPCIDKNLMEKSDGCCEDKNND